MRVHLQLLRDGTRLEETLQNDGWRLESAYSEILSVQHPMVKDEAGARQRLHRLGLLTSPYLRIDFERLQHARMAQLLN